jgi:hypothetical protein
MTTTLVHPVDEKTSHRTPRSARPATCAGDVCGRHRRATKLGLADIIAGMPFGTLGAHNLIHIGTV